MSPTMAEQYREFLRKSRETCRAAGLPEDYAINAFGRGYLRSGAPLVVVVNRGLQMTKPPLALLLGITPAVIFVDEYGVGIGAPAPLIGITREWARQEQVRLFGEIDLTTGRTVVYDHCEPV